MAGLKVVVADAGAAAGVCVWVADVLTLPLPKVVALPGPLPVPGLPVTFGAVLDAAVLIISSDLTSAFRTMGKFKASVVMAPGDCATAAVTDGVVTGDEVGEVAGAGAGAGADAGADTDAETGAAVGVELAVVEPVEPAVCTWLDSPTDGFFSASVFPEEAVLVLPEVAVAGLPDGPGAAVGVGKGLGAGGVYVGTISTGVLTCGTAMEAIAVAMVASTAD